MNVSTPEPFIEATRDLLGEHGCYPLMAIEKLKEKAAWQLYAGANDVVPEVANEISSFITKYNDKLKYASDEDKEFILIEDFIPKEYMQTYIGSLDYQGITINLKAHPCGVLLMDGDIRRKIGLISAVSETTGKRTLCACIEGNYLDDFGYVKNDYLIVDSVGLTYKFFQSIGKPVPTFDELREMIDGDTKTWDVYKNGITCCVNQVEKESTTKKVKEYSPINLAELSALIAGIRPGFKSLLHIFLARDRYSTGEPKIDELLSDSYHFMLYQESIMKILAFLGLEMGDTYNVLKSISKKKLKGKQLEDLQARLKKNWNEIIGNLDNFEKIWNVIDDSARYAFNAPHALSMGGDSAYQAWFKAHHTAKFYEVAINHYQTKNKKDKIDALVKEALNFYGYRLGDYEFGKDNRHVNINEAEKVIYPNLSSIKGFGEGVAEILYDLGDKAYPNFLSFINEVSGINKTIIEKLVKLDYFKRFGEINYLLEIIRLNEIFGGAKQITFAKIESLGLSIDFVEKYGNRTAKMINKIDHSKLLDDLIANIIVKKIGIKETMDNQLDILGMIRYTNDSYSNKLVYIHELEVMKSITKFKVYEVKTGDIHEAKMWTKMFNRLVFKNGDFVFMSTDLIKKLQKRSSGEKDPETGKLIYVDIEGQYEFWMPGYKIVTEKFL